MYVLTAEASRVFIDTLGGALFHISPATETNYEHYSVAFAS